MENLKKWLEPIGLFMLLLAFGWQCIEERTDQMKVESYFYEMNEKLIAIWSGIYDEALHSERYDGKAMVCQLLFNERSDKGLVSNSRRIIDNKRTIFSLFLDKSCSL